MTLAFELLDYFDYVINLFLLSLVFCSQLKTDR